MAQAERLLDEQILNERACPHVMRMMMISCRYARRRSRSWKWNAPTNRTPTSSNSARFRDAARSLLMTGASCIRIEELVFACGVCCIRSTIWGSRKAAWLYTMKARVEHIDSPTLFTKLRW